MVATGADTHFCSRLGGQAAADERIDVVVGAYVDDAHDLPPHPHCIVVAGKGLARARYPKKRK